MSTTKTDQFVHDDQFIDAGFESLVREVDSRIDRARLALNTKSQSEIKNAFDELCRVIRSARMDFSRVLKYYGTDYEDQAQHFVDSVICASDLAKKIDIEEVKKSLADHASHVQQLQTQMKYDE